MRRKEQPMAASRALNVLPGQLSGVADVSTIRREHTHHRRGHSKKTTLSFRTFLTIAHRGVRTIVYSVRILGFLGFIKLLFPPRLYLIATRQVISQISFLVHASPPANPRPVQRKTPVPSDQESGQGGLVVDRIYLGLPLIAQR